MNAWPFEPLNPFAFDLVEIDPPWLFNLRSAKGEAKSPQAQYKCMPLNEIAALPVGNLLAPGGVLVMWCTWPLVAAGDHVKVIRGWGLKPVTGGVWAKRTATDKMRWGTGYVARSLCEPFFIATLPNNRWNGRSFPNFVETLEAASIDGLARENSRKPDRFYEICEAAWPDARRCSIFSRQSRAGWTVWGDEATKFDEVVA